MSEAFEAQGSTWEKIKHVVTSTFKSALKWAAIGAAAIGAGGLVMAAIPGVFQALPFGAGTLITKVLSFGGADAGSIALGALKLGGVIGLGGGALMGLASGIGGADEAVAQQEEMRMAKYQRAQQLAANQEMMNMRLASMRGAQPTAAMGMPSHGLAMGAPNKGAGVGYGN